MGVGDWNGLGWVRSSFFHLRYLPRWGSYDRRVRIPSRRVRLASKLHVVIQARREEYIQEQCRLAELVVRLRRRLITFYEGPIAAYAQVSLRIHP